MSSPPYTAITTILSIRPSLGARGEEILEEERGGGRDRRSLPSLLSSPFPLETPDTRAKSSAQSMLYTNLFMILTLKHWSQESRT